MSAKYENHARAMDATDLMLQLHAQLTATRGSQQTLHSLLGATIDLSVAIATTISAARVVSDDPSDANQAALDRQLWQLEQYTRRKVRQQLRIAEQAVAALSNAARLPRCYACDSMAVSTRDKRPEGGKIENACSRHKDGQ